MTPFEETIYNQRCAASPERSAFVLANAGSGKTRVLTDRVARLLLDGVKPERILCITFTKAAAAEMAERLFNQLGAWSLLDDAALAPKLAKLIGETHKGDLAKVRRLFARALETPGGLKIQTIHSFCEGVLRRFPLEAGVAPGFHVIDDKETETLAEEALNDVAVSARQNAALADAFTRLSALKNERDLRALLLDTAHARKMTHDTGEGPEDQQAYLSDLARKLGADASRTDEQLQQELVATLDRDKLEEARQALDEGGGNARNHCAKPLGGFLAAIRTKDAWTALKKLFVKTNGEPRDKYGNGQTRKEAPWVEPYLQTLEAEFIACAETVAATTVYHDTAAYLSILEAAQSSFGKKKTARAGLDYDDLITHTQRLIASTPSDWIMYKLDQGIDHILVDEAQDTSPGQWRVIEGLLEEIVAGEGAHEKHRTFFAVGDIKQSIYSFQGADVTLFPAKEHDLGKRLDAVGAYKNVPLTLSFRTTKPVLQFVDALFVEDEAREGLGDAAINHGVHREGEAGLVELWPLTPHPEKRETNPWDAPVDAPAPDDPVRLLSAQIADAIASWRKDNRLLPSKGRAIAPGDIMILVQSRGRLFDEVIRALARADVPVAGADKLKLLEDAAIEDLLSCARFVLTPSDDLSLAEVLTSPLVGVGDEALFDIAHGRGPKTLWQALKDAAKDCETLREAERRLSAARQAALREGPYRFFSDLLECGCESGKKKLFERLSLSAQESVDELLRQALEYENSHPRNLRGFLSWFEDRAGEIKREMDRTEDAVRVMTVHGAKGLEAEIVFLIDAHRKPDLRYLGPVFSLENDPTAAALQASALATSKDRDCAATAAAREAAKHKQYEEYRRLLYVAATRAREQLFICGVESGKEKDPMAKPVGERSWHALATAAFERLGDAVEDGEILWKKPIKRLVAQQTRPTEKKDARAALAAVETPDWAFEKVANERGKRRLAPSRLLDEEDDLVALDGGGAYSPSAGDRYRRGRVLHRLLELLPEIVPAQRRNAADRLLAVHARDIDQAERLRWREEVLTVLEDGAFAPVFAEGSRAEVAIAGTPKGADRSIVVSGQIDRLVVSKECVLAVDYKTNRPPPKNIKDAAPAYIAQMAAYRSLLQEIYPDHQIKTALLWTFDAALMPIPDDLLEQAFVRHLAPG